MARRSVQRIDVDPSGALVFYASEETVTERERTVVEVPVAELRAQSLDVLAESVLPSVPEFLEVSREALRRALGELRAACAAQEARPAPVPAESSKPPPPRCPEQEEMSTTKPESAGDAAKALWVRAMDGTRHGPFNAAALSSARKLKLKLAEQLQTIPLGIALLDGAEPLEDESDLTSLCSEELQLLVSSGRPAMVVARVRPMSRREVQADEREAVAEIRIGQCVANEYVAVWHMAYSNNVVSLALVREQSDLSVSDDRSLDGRLRQCLIGRGLYQEVKQLLEDKADANCRLRYKLGPKEFDGTPLTLAVKLDKPNIVRLLMIHRANAQSAYSMKAGRTGVLWKGPAVCATVAKGNLSMMRLLVEYEANLQGRVISFNDEPNVTLLYDASYFGHAHLVRYLLQQKGNPDIPVKFQDDMSITKTALQVSASLGHDEVVRVLLSAKAQISLGIDFGPQELKDAIDGCHVEVLRLLVDAGADLFAGTEGRRGVDYLFQANNAVLTAAAAKGLRGCDEDVVACMGLKDFVRFLATPDAEEILGAVFRKCELRYWKNEKRVAWKTAYLPHGDLNVAVGPAKGHFDDKFHKEMEFAAGVRSTIPDQEDELVEEEFFKQLLPYRFQRLDQITQVPIEISHCVLPGLHRNPEVLWVLASGVNDRVFDEKGAHAIINLAWRETYRVHFLSFALDLLVACLFWSLAFLMNNEYEWLEEWMIWPCLIVAALAWLRNACMEFLQCLGFHVYGKLSEYFLSLETLADAFRIFLTGFSLTALVIDWKACAERQELRLIFAITGFVRWLRVLNTLKGFESTGKPMLPILQAIPATVPFFFVVFCWFAGFLHMYYSFGLMSWWQSMMIMWRLGFLADFSRNEMRNVTLLSQGEADWEWPVDIVLVAMGVSMSIIMMNILIGVLAESYNRGWEHRERLFLLERSRLVLHHFTIYTGWEKCPCACAKRRIQSEANSHHVWFANARDPSTWGEIQSQYDADVMNVHEKVTELRREIREMHEKMLEKYQDHSEELHSGPDPVISRRLGNLESCVQGMQAKMDLVLSKLGDSRAS
ncbi:FEM1B [Symbiodinium sp. CCMP2456]|nr:FEM1B [Symbiodinium sp. CCMP2456]